MATGKESIKSRELLFRKPNPFEWSEYKEHHHKRLSERIMADPYGCDECGDIYNKKDLIKLKKDTCIKNDTRILLEIAFICRNCV